MKKTIIILTIIIAFVINSFCEDNTKDSLKSSIIKAFEFSIGGGFTHGGLLQGVSKKTYLTDNPIDFETEGIFFPLYDMTLMCSFSVSFIFYINKKVGIGFINNLAMNQTSFYKFDEGEKVTFIQKRQEK